MRLRAEIQEEILESNAENVGAETVPLLQLEVLLDIRDLLVALAYGSKVKTKEIYHGRNQRLHSENHQHP